MNTQDKVTLAILALGTFALTIVGGLFYPSTVAGTIAKAFFSLS